jgi:SNF family Na+-dependent transporter
LAFIAYPEAISNMPAPTVWAVLFFFMMLIIGFSSEVSTFVFEKYVSYFNQHFNINKGAFIEYEFIDQIDFSATSSL